MSITEFWLKNIYRSHGIRHKDLEFPREIFRASFAPYMSPPFLSELFCGLLEVTNAILSSHLI